MQPRMYDRFWPYPEVAGQIGLVVGDADSLAEVVGLIRAGDTDAIDDWISRTRPRDLVGRLLRLGLPAREHYHTPLFDEILLGTRSYDDGPGCVEYVLSRRVGREFRHRVSGDRHGDVLYEYSTARPMTKREFRELTTYPAPWEDPGHEDELAETSVWSVWDDR